MWLLLETKTDLVIDIDEPRKYNWTWSDPWATDDVEQEVVDEFKWIPPTDEVSDDDLNLDQQEEKAERLKAAESKRKCQDRCSRCMKAICCFTDYNEEFDEERKPNWK